MLGLESVSGESVEVVNCERHRERQTGNAFRDEAKIVRIVGILIRVALESADVAALCNEYNLVFDSSRSSFQKRPRWSLH